MIHLKIAPVQWGAGVYCAFSGLAMLVTPHQFLSPGYAVLQPQLWLWGLLFLLAGSSMLVATLLRVSSRVMLISHLLTGTSLLILAGSYGSGQIWSGMINLTVLGLGTLFTAFPLDAFKSEASSERPSGDLLSLLVGVAMFANGTLMLLAPTQYYAPLYEPIRPYIAWFGAAFVLGGVLLVYRQSGPVRRRPATFRGLSHFVAGAILFTFLPLVVIFQISRGIPYYGVIAVMAALIPYQARIKWRTDGRALRTRLALAMVLVAAVPLVLMTAWYSNQSEQETRSEALANMQTLSTAVASSVQNYAYEHRNAVLTLAADPDLMNLTAAKQRALLQVSALAYPDIVAFSIFDSSGKPLARSDELPLTPLLPSVLASIKDSTGSIDTVVMSPLLHRPALVFGSPVLRPDGSLSGIVLVAVESARISEFLANTHSPNGGIVYLVDETGRVIADPDQTLMAGLTNLDDTAPVAAFLAHPTEPGALTFGAPATEHLAGYAGVQGMGWGVVVEQPVAIALAVTHAAREQLLILVLIFLVAAALAGVQLAGGMTAPLSHMVEAIAAMSTDARSIPLPASGILELDRLADAFGTMSERVASRTSELTAMNSSLLTEIAIRTRVEVTLLDSEERYTSVIASLEEGIVLQSSAGSILAINGSAERMLGISAGEMMGISSFYTHLLAVSEDGTPLTDADNPTSLTLRTGLPCSHVIVGICRSAGNMTWLSVNSQPLCRPGQEQPYAVVSSLTDITERKLSQEVLREMAIRDELTGLFNRREMIRLLSDEAVRSESYNRPVSLLMLDVDHFKAVNDTYGHQVGDEVLQWVATQFRMSLRETDHSARYGGEEFAAILPATTAIQAMQIAERVRRSIAAVPFSDVRADGEAIEIPLTVSIGVADIADIIRNGAPAQAIIEAADLALYQAKRSGRNRSIFFGQTLLDTLPLMTRPLTTVLLPSMPLTTMHLPEG